MDLLNPLLVRGFLIKEEFPKIIPLKGKIQSLSKEKTVLFKVNHGSAGLGIHRLDPTV